MSWNGVTATATGGVGFIGSHLVEHLAAHGARLRLLDNRMAATAVHHMPAEFIQADMRDPQQTAAGIAGSEVVFHLATIANLRACQAQPGLAFDVNVVGTKQVLDAEQGARRVVFLSSAAVFGQPVRLPMDEAHPPSWRRTTDAAAPFHNG